MIRSLAAGDRSEYDKDLPLYEVDSISKLEQSNDAIPQDVRVLELLYPTGAFAGTSGNLVRPLIDTQGEFIHPLLYLVNAGKVPPPTFSQEPAHALRTEVFVLAGRFDEAVDYRTSIALAYMYPKHYLFIAK